MTDALGKALGFPATIQRLPAPSLARTNAYSSSAEQRLSYYHHIAATSTSISDAALLSMTLGTASLPKTMQISRIIIKEEMGISALPKPRVNKLLPSTEATGAHTSFKFDSVTGRISGYETYEINPYTWSAKLRFRGTGKPHGSVNPPFILERPLGKGPGAAPIVPRQPEPWELPNGY